MIPPKLSKLQRQLLRWLLEEFDRRPQHRWSGGVRVGPSAGLSRSESAAISRAWRRLEARGLIRRMNHVSEESQRATHIALTDEGRAVAQSLSEAK